MNNGAKIRAGNTARWAVLGVALIAFPAQLWAGKILIYGPNLVQGPVNEATLATAAGHTVTVADAVTWSNMTTADFAAFDAIVFGDPGCGTDLSLLQAANANKTVWSSAIGGNIIVIGTDPIFHGSFVPPDGQSQQLVTNGINFAASGPGTGLYVSLSCFYFNAPPGTSVEFLNLIGNFTVQGEGLFGPCHNTVTIVNSSHPAMAGLTDAGLSNWDCSVHEWFISFPSSFSALATDGLSGLPYIIAFTTTLTLSCTPQHLALGPTAPASTTSGSCSTSNVSPPGGTFMWSVNTNTVTLDPAGGAANYFSANPSASQGDTVISVTYTVSGQHARAQSQPITVHMPTALLVVSDTTDPTGTNCSLPCLAHPGDGTCDVALGTVCNFTSYLRVRTYSVLDQFNPPNQFTDVGINDANPTEQIPFTTTCPNFTLDTPPFTQTTVFQDGFRLCHTCCEQGGPGCTVQTNPVQTLFVNGLAVRTETITYTCSGVTLTP